MKNLDVIYINKLIVPCLIGVFEHERKNKQNLVISLKLFVDARKAGQSDDLQDTINYHAVARTIYDLATNTEYYLIEKLAQVIADSCLKNTYIHQVTVTIEKPKALSFATSAAIEITRSNEDHKKTKK